MNITGVRDIDNIIFSYKKQMEHLNNFNKYSKELKYIECEYKKFTPNIFNSIESIRKHPDRTVTHTYYPYGGQYNRYICDDNKFVDTFHTEIKLKNSYNSKVILLHDHRLHNVLDNRIIYKEQHY
jgi:hypothetical protein